MNNPQDIFNRRRDTGKAYCNYHSTVIMRKTFHDGIPNFLPGPLKKRKRTLFRGQNSGHSCPVTPPRLTDRVTHPETCRLTAPRLSALLARDEALERA
jgi:hypothetical protein